MGKTTINTKGRHLIFSSGSLYDKKQINYFLSTYKSLSEWHDRLNNIDITDKDSAAPTFYNSVQSLYLAQKTKDFLKFEEGMNIFNKLEETIKEERFKHFLEKVKKFHITKEMHDFLKKF